MEDATRTVPGGGGTWGTIKADAAELVGRGPRGTVWRVQGAGGTFRAVKRIPTGLDPELESGLRARLTDLDALGCPGAMPGVVASADVAGLVVTMPHADGGSLARRARRSGYRRDDLTWALPLLDALCRAHASGLFHVGVHPANVLFISTTPGAGETAVLSDWFQGWMVGSPGTPVIRCGRQVDAFRDPSMAPDAAPIAANDLYSLAATCAWALGGGPAISAPPGRRLRAGPRGLAAPSTWLAGRDDEASVVLRAWLQARAASRPAEVGELAGALAGMAASSLDSPDPAHPADPTTQSLAGRRRGRPLRVILSRELQEGGAAQELGEGRKARGDGVPRGVGGRGRLVRVATWVIPAALIATALAVRPAATPRGPRSAGVAVGHSGNGGAVARRSAQTHPGRCAPSARGGTVQWARLGRAGCPIAVVWSPAAAVAALSTGSGSVVARYSIGLPGDQLVVGDWWCTGIDAPAIYRPSSGWIFYFKGWTAARSWSVQQVDDHVTWGTARRVKRDRKGATSHRGYPRCDRVAVVAR